MAWKMMSFKLCEEHSTRQTMTRDRAVTQATCLGAQKKGQLLRVMCGANVLGRIRLMYVWISQIREGVMDREEEMGGHGWVRDEGCR